MRSIALLTQSVWRSQSHLISRRFLPAVTTTYIPSVGKRTGFSATTIMDMKLGDMRKPYRSADQSFDVDSLVESRNPFDQFELWMEHALACKGSIGEPNAMALATASADGQPSVRMVLLKHYDPNGFVFFTSFGSRKGHDLAENSKAAILFYWEHINRQIRIEGVVDQLSEEAADAYWTRRPYKSQISAASGLLQSSVVPNKAVLRQHIKEVAEKYPEPGPVPRPSDWGGYRLDARVFEFWQGQTNRDHDRFRFTLDDKDENWVIERLAP